MKSPHEYSILMEHLLSSVLYCDASLHWLLKSVPIQQPAHCPMPYQVKRNSLTLPFLTLLSIYVSSSQSDYAVLLLYSFSQSAKVYPLYNDKPVHFHFAVHEYYPLLFESLHLLLLFQIPD